MHLAKNKRDNTVSTHLLSMRDMQGDMNPITTPITTPIHTTTMVITTLTPFLISVVVLEAEDSEVVAGAEDVEDLDRIRDPIWGEFEPRVPIKQGSTAGSEMALPFFGNLL